MLIFYLQLCGVISRVGGALGLPFPEALKPYLKAMQQQQENKIKITNKEEVE